VIGPDDVRLDGRVAVVTGAAMGIGAAVALALARFGADIAACDRDGDRLQSVLDTVEAAGRTAHAGVLDVRDGDAVRTWVADVVSRCGRIDIVVNNAGGGFAAPFLDVSDKGQDTLVQENFGSVTNVVRACVPHMPYGSSIVNVTSIEAHRAGPGFAIYSAMKAAVANLTKSLALELGERGIRVNCVAPDVVPTPGIGDLGGPARTPLGRWGHVDDVAGAVAWLAGPTASFVTGTTVHVDGGNGAAGGWHRDQNGGFTP
jgi:3-oxoacyl-[acyl-carrier protein] reductase